MRCCTISRVGLATKGGHSVLSARSHASVIIAPARFNRMITDENSEKKTATPEDEPKTLIFVDMLGFAAITKEYQVRVQEFRDESSGFAGASTTEMQNRLNRFDTVLRMCLFEETRNGGIQAMVFSDCAFLVFDTSLRAALVAISLMRSFIKK